MGDEVEREVEGRDGEDGADGKALHEAPAIFVAFGEIERDGFAAEAYGFFGSGFEGEDGAIDFRAGETQGLAGFGDDELGESVLLIEESSGDVFEDLAAFPAWQGAGAAQAGDCMIDGLACIGAGGYGYAADESAVPRRADFERLTVDPFFAAKKKAGLRAGTHFHGRRTPEVCIERWYKDGARPPVEARPPKRLGFGLPAALGSFSVGTARTYR